MSASDLHVESFRTFVTDIQARGLVPRTALLEGATWRVVVVPRPLRTYTVTCDSTTRRLTVHLRRLLRRRLVLDESFTADTLGPTVARAAASVLSEIPRGDPRLR